MSWEPDAEPRRSTVAPFTEVTEGDLRLRPPRLEEAELYARWWDDEEVRFGFCCESRTADEIRAAFPELEAEARDIGHWIDFVIEVEGRPVGSVWLSHWDLESATCDMNVLIGEAEYRNRGIARRAIRLLARWAFRTMELQRIYLCPREDHIPALRCYEAAGARRGGIRDEVVRWRDETVCFRETYLLPEDLCGEAGR
jgi:RimJ/RimL family protein N-acetyltransferase